MQFSEVFCGRKTDCRELKANGKGEMETMVIDTLEEGQQNRLMILSGQITRGGSYLGGWREAYV